MQERIAEVVSLDAIKIRENVRKHFDKGALAELAESKRSEGSKTIDGIIKTATADELWGLVMELVLVRDLIGQGRNFGQILKLWGIDRKKIEAQVKADGKKPKAPEIKWPPNIAKIDPELKLALEHFADHEKRWAERRKKGLTDKELKEAIGQEFGEMSGSGGPGRTGHTARGGQSPRFWLGQQKGKPSLEGAALVARVRMLMEIPEPVQGQKRKEEICSTKK